jgi:hypothetical protein
MAVEQKKCRPNKMYIETFISLLVETKLAKYTIFKHFVCGLFTLNPKKHFPPSWWLLKKRRKNNIVKN